MERTSQSAPERPGTGRPPEPFPATTALGSLARHLTESDPRHFQPANVNYGLFEELPGKVKKRERRAAYAGRARRELLEWAERHGMEVDRSVFEAEHPEAVGA